jgi:hypothetical protein
MVDDLGQWAGAGREQRRDGLEGWDIRLFQSCGLWGSYTRCVSSTSCSIKIFLVGSWKEGIKAMEVEGQDCQGVRSCFVCSETERNQGDNSLPAIPQLYNFPYLRKHSHTLAEIKQLAPRKSNSVKPVRFLVFWKLFSIRLSE